MLGNQVSFTSNFVMREKLKKKKKNTLKTWKGKRMTIGLVEYFYIRVGVWKSGERVMA